MSERPTFLSELKRRNVYKVAVAFVVVSWLLIQAASIMLPAFEAPAWVMKVLIAALLIGFPIALAFSWAFEITPEGIKRESEVAPDQSISHHTGKKLIALTVVLSVLAAGLFAFQMLRPKAERAEGGAAGPPDWRTMGPATPPSKGLAGARPSTPKAESTSDSIPVHDKSIAVLPFDNLSDDKSNGYFAEGIQDEILTRLSKISALKVISRTSTKKYQSSPDNLKEVARDLGVAHVLEGSVQKIANAVKVNVQLIRAATDEHVWAESYNRKLDDVFGVEGEVANAIADQLQAKLTGAEAKAITDKPTQNAAAYDAYLRGLAIEHNRYSYAAYQEAEASYQKATELDPQFALAWSRVAVIRSFLFFNSVDPARYTDASVKEAADRAFQLRPDLGESLVAQAAYKYRVLRDFPAALESYREGSRRMPNNALIFEYLAYVERRMGHWKDAEEHYRRSAELDPLNLQLFVSMGSEFLNLLRRFDEALAMLGRALQVSPNDESTLANIAAIYQTTGRLDQARAELAKIAPNPTDPFVNVVRVAQLFAEHRFGDAVSLLQGIVDATKASGSVSTASAGFMVQLGYAYEFTGHKDEARATFARAVHAIKPTPDSKVPIDSLGLPNMLALAYAGLGEKEKALAQAKEAVKAYETDAVAKPSSEMVLAQIQARFGETENALAALPHLLTETGGLNPADLRNDPLWDPIRKDPRFQKLSAGENVAQTSASQ